MQGGGDSLRGITLVYEIKKRNVALHALNVNFLAGMTYGMALGSSLGLVKIPEVRQSFLGFLELIQP